MNYDKLQKIHSYILNMNAGTNNPGNLLPEIICKINF